LIPAGLLVIVPPPAPAFVTVRTGFSVKDAVTLFDTSIVISQEPVALMVHATLQPVKLESALGEAVRVTRLLKLLNDSVQVVPQSIPFPETLPPPVPPIVTVRIGLRVNVATTDFALSRVTAQVPLPLQAPLQPAKFEFASGVTVSVTRAFAPYASPQSSPQSMPAGMLFTVPLPVPVLLTERANGCRVKVAVTDFAASIVTTQASVPLQASLQPVKMESSSAVTVRITVFPTGKGAEQVVPQLIPGRSLITRPWPLPALVTVRSGPA
jgi:hypothetical protein